MRKIAKENYFELAVFLIGIMPRRFSGFTL
jgi:hypothetical protein